MPVLFLREVYCHSKERACVFIMHIKQLKSFITVARTKNMAQTALALNYSHSTIFVHLESLEKEYGTKLYTRTSRGIELTPKGEILLEYAKKFVELYDASYAALSELKQASLSVGASESGDVCFMHELLGAYIHSEPNLEIEYAKMTSDVAISKLIAGTCDIAIVCEFDFHAEDIHFRYLGTLPLVFVTSPNYLKSIQNKERSALPILLGTMKTPVAVRMLQSVGLDFYEHFSTLSNIGDLATIRQLLQYNRGIALLPKLYVKQDLCNGTLVQIPNMLQEPWFIVSVLTASRHRIDPKTKELIDYIIPNT